MEVVEEHIVYGKPGKGVEQAAHHRPAFPADIAPQVDKAGQGGAGELQHQEGGHEIGHRLAGEGDGQPEEGASQEIEGVGAHKVGPQVRGPAPPHVAGAHCVVAHLVKGHLLDVEVPVIEEIPVVHNDKGQKDQERQSQPVGKGFQIIVGTPAQKTALQHPL